LRSSTIGTLWAFTIVEFIALAVLAAVRMHIWTYGADTGTFAQIVSDPQMRDGLEAGSHFRYHWSPSLMILSPLAFTGHLALALQIVQAAATVITAPMLYALSRRYVSEGLAFRLGVIGLLYPPLLAVGFDEFHEVGLFTPLALGLILAADRAQWGWYAFCAILAIGLREDICVELIVVGIVFAAIGARPKSSGAGLLDGAPRDPRALTLAGVGVAVAASGALLLYFGVIVPRLGGWKPEHFYSYPFAQGPVPLAIALITQPISVLAATLTFGRLTYVLEALIPLAMLPLLSPWVLLALPGAAIVLLANSGLVWRMGNHYAALWIPWLLLAACSALTTVTRRYGAQTARSWEAVALFACVLFLLAFNPTHPLHFLHPNYHDLANARRALACVPANASLSTHDEWYTQIAQQRPNATVNQTQGVDYVVYADDYPNAWYQSQLRPGVRAQVSSGTLRPVCRYGAVVAYKTVVTGARH
jgi:uncharacterized membrane protein